MEKFFDEQAGETGADPALWLAQAELFICWGLDPEGGKRADQFWNFLERSSPGGASEAVFKESFGFSYAEATAHLARYGAEPRTLRWQLDASRARLPALELRDASSSEIARIRGEWERLETRYVRKQLPELEINYLMQARWTLRRAIEHGDKDPRLLASIGLLELDADNEAGARKYLEEAADHGIVKPRANFELAQLRYNALQGRSKRNDGKLETEQAGPVLDLLLAATRQSPALPQVYALLAEVCAALAEPPSGPTLAVIDEGVRLFPKDPELKKQFEKLPAH